MIEVELKAVLSAEQRGSLPERLAQLGFFAQDHVHEIDIYWNGNDRDFRKTDEALRLRTCCNLADGTTETLLTYKGAKQDLRSSTRLEYETTVGHGETAHNLLAALGYRAQFTVEKTRRTFTREAVTVCLDEVTGLGPFIELESLVACEMQREKTVDMLLQLLQELGVDASALTRKSYLELLIASATL